EQLLPAPPADPQAWSLVSLDETGSHLQSDATLQIYRRLGGIFRVLSLARIIPRFIRNPVYRLIARNRYRWFGKNEVCRIPSEAERDRFLP
ncbi:MAG: thiol-disulfide oxidoreductase DCC family protein, partial [Planctomycetota bacterium]